MITLKPLPDEHIYSYLYRGYSIYGIDAFQTIINADGLFKRRIGVIKPEHVRPFIARARDISRACHLSGFACFSLELQFGYKTQYFDSSAIPPGLKIVPLNKTKPHEISFCPRCIQSFITTYGCAYLLSSWLSSPSHCEKHNTLMIKISPKNRKEALFYLKKIFIGIEDFSLFEMI